MGMLAVAFLTLVIALCSFYLRVFQERSTAKLPKTFYLVNVLLIVVIAITASITLNLVNELR